jgi:hypothetical protein
VLADDFGCGGIIPDVVLDAIDSEFVEAAQKPGAEAAPWSPVQVDLTGTLSVWILFVRRVHAENDNEVASEGGGRRAEFPGCSELGT